MEQLPNVEAIGGAIIVVRGERVMLDADLARLYGVSTERLNEQVRRNRARFPPDFMFQMTIDEWQGMYPQIAGTLQRTKGVARNLPQFAGGSQESPTGDRLYSRVAGR